MRTSITVSIVDDVAAGDVVDVVVHECVLVCYGLDVNKVEVAMSSILSGLMAI